MKNAVEASPSGETIAINVDDGELARVSIHNAGAIPEAIKGRFFEKFVTAGKKNGTGLGAYSARLMVNALKVPSSSSRPRRRARRSPYSCQDLDKRCRSYLEGLQ